MEKSRVGVIGTGMICRVYIDNISSRFSVLELAAIADRKIEKAKAVAEEYGVKGCTIDELMEDDSIDIILNLTPPVAHYELMKRALLAGKHFYTEKTFTMNVIEAQELIMLAQEKNLMIGSAPDTFFASWVQNARHIIDSGRLGRITSFAMIGNRDNDKMLPAMRYLNGPGGGVLYDYVCYYLTVLINLLGPVATVSANVKAPYKRHIDNFPPSETKGTIVETPNESQVYSILEMENGITGTLSVNCDSCYYDRTYFAIYGNKGILYLACPDWFNGEISIYENTTAPEDAENQKVTVIEDPYAFKTNSRGVGLADMVWARIEGREPRVNAERCLHVLEIEERMKESSDKDGLRVHVASTCTRCLPLSIPTDTEESALRVK
ncbi:Gfo/Idh/MocA family protein [Bilifractor sp. HCP3S3_D3]|uniref:Gfo/Idh/MocA family protein n=1 Tax=Bilifractor sp. HCP3S3_D3 TaxID=3438907 RepID=UPI003F89DF00